MPEVVRCRPCFPSCATCKPPFRSERSERRNLHRSTVNFNVNAFFATEACADLQRVTILSSITPLRARDSVWPPHVSEKDKQLRPPSSNETAQPEPAKRNPGLARARCIEKAVSFARANYIGKADSFARANYIDKADSFARAPHNEKATLPPGQFPGESGVPFCMTALAGDFLPLRFFLPSRFSASFFRQNGMAVGLSLWCRLPVRAESTISP